MPYDVQPTLAELREKVRRDLRDSEGVFLDAQVTDFIQMGMVELNRTRPVEKRVEYAGDTDFASEVLPFTYVFAVELSTRRDVADVHQWETIHPMNASHGYGRNGWEFWAGRLHLWSGHVSGIANNVDRYGADQVTIAVWGYGDRALPELDADIMDFTDSVDEMAVRKYAQFEGLRALDQDRALFAQWQTQANNSDISTTQLNQMVNAASGDWDRMRKRIFTIRRPLTG